MLKDREGEDEMAAQGTERATSILVQAERATADGSEEVSTEGIGVSQGTLRRTARISQEHFSGALKGCWEPVR